MPRHPSSVTELGWEPYLGAEDSLVYVDLLGRRPKIQSILEEAVAAMNAALVATGYENPCDWIGSYNKRLIAGYSPETWSTHSYGIALDVDYGGGDDPGIDRNPHVHRPIESGDPGFGVEWQILEPQVRAIEAIRNGDGDQMWRWLGWPIGDTMHWQIAVAPQFVDVDWTTVAGEEQEDEMNYETMRAAEFDLWTDENIVEAYDAGMFQDPNRAGFIDYWVTDRAERTDAEKARFLTDYYAHLWKRG